MLFLKTHLEIKDRKKLTGDNIEYQYGRFVMNK
jgi:hypothetical protein